MSGSTRATGATAGQVGGTASTAGTAAGAEPSIGELVALASKELRTLVRQEVELAKVEMSRSAKSAGLGAGLLGAAGFLGFFAFFAITICIGEAIALALPRWLSFLLVAVLYGLLAGPLALMAKRRLTKVSPPNRTIATVREDLEWAKHPTSASNGTRPSIDLTSR